MANLPKIVVATKVEDMDTPSLCSNAKGVKTTGDADVVSPPHTDAQLETQADKVLVIHDKRVTDTSPSLTKDEEVEVAILETMYNEVAVYVQQIARKVARAAGDVAAGEAVVLRCGFKMKSKAEKSPRIFEVVDSGPGWMHIRVKSAGKYGAYVWRFGVTPSEGKIPDSFEPILITLECEVIITNMKRGEMYGIQHADVLPASNSQPSVENKSRKPAKRSISAGTDPLNWSDFIYVGCI